jgi:hypothetical protein
VPLAPAEWRGLEALSLVISKTGGLRRSERF